MWNKLFSRKKISLFFKLLKKSKTTVNYLRKNFAPFYTFFDLRYNKNKRHLVIINFVVCLDNINKMCQCIGRCFYTSKWSFFSTEEFSFWSHIRWGFSMFTCVTTSCFVKRGIKKISSVFCFLISYLKSFTLYFDPFGSDLRYISYCLNRILKFSFLFRIGISHHPNEVLTNFVPNAIVWDSLISLVSHSITFSTLSSFISAAHNTQYLHMYILYKKT